MINQIRNLIAQYLLNLAFKIAAGDEKMSLATALKWHSTNCIKLLADQTGARP